MVSHKELESVVEQINESYARLDNRIAELEQTIKKLAVKTVKKESTKRLDFSIVLWYSRAN